jgi:hypothetical protein
MVSGHRSGGNQVPNYCVGTDECKVQVEGDTKGTEKLSKDIRRCTSTIKPRW